jgi:hypothetical protein
MKLLMKSAMVRVVLLAVAADLFAQRVADWDDPNGQAN